MNRDLLFMSGEFRVTLPLVMKRDRWSHTMSNCELASNSDGTFSRKGVTESLRGLVIHASAEDTVRRLQNLSFIIDRSIPCWPDPQILAKLENRHDVMKMCIDAGLTTDRVIQVVPEQCIDLSYPFVVKTGNDHVGVGKHLCKTYVDIPEWTGVATAEPFYSGESIRVLFIGESVFGLKYDNESSWIKNSAGCEIFDYKISDRLLAHARSVRDCFSLEICGIDYIVEPSGKFHFLEYNQFPGLDSTDQISAAATTFLTNKMIMLENPK